MGILSTIYATKFVGTIYPGKYGLIRRINERYPETVCAIISGYADFEYARGALRLSVFDYLLKPIHPDSLEALLKKLHETLEARYAEAERSFFYDLVNGRIGGAANPPQPYEHYYAAVAYAGALSSSARNGANPHRMYWETADMDALANLFSAENGKVWFVNGGYSNGRVIIAASDSDGERRVRAACLSMKDRLAGDVPVNIICGRGTRDINAIPQIVGRLNVMLNAEIIFGRSNVFFEDGRGSDLPSITPVMEEIITKTSKISSLESIKKNFAVLAGEWENSNRTQLALQTMLNRLFGLVSANLGLTSERNAFPDANEIIMNSNNYARLYQNVCEALGLMFSLRGNKSAGNLSARELADKIERYLNDNYTKTITYKIFNEMYGYNENYITNVFKKIKGISPSKYVTKLRIDKSIEILSRQPGILLKNVSELVGYDDPLYFSRVFRDATGLSPSDYVKNLPK